MMQKFTPSVLLQFIYRETSLGETMAIQEALSEDPLLQEQYDEMLSGYLELPKAKFSPRPETRNRILRHSERTAAHPSL